MSYAARQPDRYKAAAIAIAIQAGLVYALLTGLHVGGGAVVTEGLKLFQVAPPPVPPREKTIPPRERIHKPKGAAAPPNLRSKATEIVAPEPIIVVPPPPAPVIVAPVSGLGSDASSGAADRPGPGTGAGGIGNGTGSGGSGDGGGSGLETPPRLKKGRIKDSDYPRGPAELGIGGTVGVRYRVDLDGRARSCVVTHSSGNGELDEATCRLIEQRFVYRPALDEDGKPVVSWIVKDNDWIMERLPPEPRRR